MPCPASLCSSSDDRRASEFVGLATSQPFAALKQHVSMKSDGCIVLATAVVILVGKGKVFPYSLPSVGPGADPGVQAVSPQVT